MKSQWIRLYHITVYSICFVYFCYLWTHWEGQIHGVDLRCYLQAAQGNFSSSVKFLYPRWTALFWKPALLLPFHIVYTINYLIGCGIYFWITHLLLKKDIGGIIAIVGLKTFSWSLDAGNVYPILAALATNPLGIIVATLFKFPLAGFGLVLFAFRFKRRIANKSLTRFALRYHTTDAASCLHTTE